MDLAQANLRTLHLTQAIDDVATVNAKRRRLFTIAALIGSRYNLTVDDFKGPDRTRAVSWPRQEFMVAAKQAGFSLPQIGRFLNRDHTTILHGIRAAHKRRDA